MNPPVVILAFANDRSADGRYLRELPLERSEIRKALEPAVMSHRCELVDLPFATPSELFDTFQHELYRNRIAVLHFAGHAGSYQLILEAVAKQAAAISGSGLAAFLALQHELQLVFLNGCATQGHVQGLLDAGVAAVIATSRAVRDDVARELAGRFYRGLGGGIGVRQAYDEAVQVVRAGRLVNGRSTRDLYLDAAAAGDERLPWELRIRPGAERVEGWTLGTPPLPPLTPRDLPEVPFRPLQRFTRNHAELFFGREVKLWELYEGVLAVNAPPVILLHGQSGVGKSSLLEAGLLPRLEAIQQIRHANCDPAVGLLGTFARTLGADVGSEAASVAEAWRRVEEECDRPLLVILDQVEEALIPEPNPTAHLAVFARALGGLFRDSTRRPRGKLVLGFRKEWLADVESALEANDVPRKPHFVRRLSREEIVAAITGIERVRRLSSHFGLTVERGLPERIADDLLEDEESHIAPLLQILLAGMWEVAIARDRYRPRFDAGVYQSLTLYRGGVGRKLVLDDFLSQQLDALRTSNGGAVDSGLALDFLAYHTTPYGTARGRTSQQVAAEYPHQPAVIPGLRQRSMDLYLLTGPAAEGTGSTDVTGTSATRLAHDTLAPLVRKRFDESDAPGQRARRILESRAAEWGGQKVGRPLDATDLGTVEAGRDGMRGWTPNEERLVAASRSERDRARKRRNLWWSGGIALTAAVILAANAALVQARRATAAAKRVTDAALLTAASAQVDPVVGALLLAELDGSNEPPHGLQLGLEIASRALPIAVFAGGAEAVSSATFSPDGKRLVVASKDSAARVWHADGRGEPVVLRHPDVVITAAFSPESERVVTAAGAAARIWKADGSGEPVVLKHGGDVTIAGFSPDGDRVLTVSNRGDTNAAWVWNSDGVGEPVVLKHPEPVTSAAFSHDGRWVLTGSQDGTVRVWSADGSGEPVVLEIQYGGSVVSAAFARDGRRVVAAARLGGTRVWNVDGWGELVAPGHRGEVTSAALSPDGQRVVTAIDYGAASAALVWDADRKREPLQLRHSGPVASAAFSPDGRHVLTASWDSTARVWPVDSSSEPLILQHGASLWGAAFSRDGDRIVTASEDGSVRVWRTKGPGEPVVLEHAEPVKIAAFSLDGGRVVTGSYDDTARVWRADGTGKPVLLAQGAWVTSAAFTSDGRVATIEDGAVRVWNADGVSERLVLKHGGRVTSAAFSRDGRRLVTGSVDSTARVWNADGTGDPVVLRHPAEVKSVAFSPDGRRVVVVSYGAARVWDADGSGEPVVLQGELEEVKSAAFDSDGRRVVTASIDHIVNGAARVWNADGSGTPVVLKHSNEVTSAAFSPDGRRVVTASVDGAARVWNADGTGEPLVLRHGRPVMSAAFSPDGERVVTASFDGTARVWRVTWDAVVAYARSATSTYPCLEPAERHRILGELEDEARKHYEDCEGRRLRTP